MTNKSAFSILAAGLLLRFDPYDCGTLCYSAVFRAAILVRWLPGRLQGCKEQEVVQKRATGTGG